MKNKKESISKQISSSGNRSFILGIALIIFFLLLPYFGFIISEIKYQYALKTLTSDCDISSSPKGQACIIIKYNEREEYLSKYKNINDCVDAEKKNLCVFLIARTTNNPSVCYTQLKGFNEQELCIYNMAKYTMNKSLCDSFTSSCRASCINYIEFIQKSYSEWENSITFSNDCFQDPSETICAFRTCYGRVLPFALSEITPPFPYIMNDSIKSYNISDD